MTDWWTCWDFWACLVPVALFALVAIWMWFDEGDDFPLDVFGPIMGAAIAAFVAYFVIAGLANWWLPHRDIADRWDLMILKDRSMVSGEAVLGSGQVKDVAGYSFYIDGGTWQRFVILRGSNAVVYQDLKPGQKPWIVLFQGCHLWGRIAPCFWDGTQVNEIHVPPGTIKPSLVLNGAAS